MRHDVFKEQWEINKLKDPTHPCNHHLTSKCRCRGDCSCHYVRCSDSRCDICVQATVGENGIVRNCGKTDESVIKFNWCKEFKEKPCTHKEWTFKYTTFTQRGLESVLKCNRCGYYMVAKGYVP